MRKLSKISVKTYALIVEVMIVISLGYLNDMQRDIMNDLRNLLVWYLSLPPTRQDLIQSQWPEGRLQWGLEEWKVGHESKLEPCWTMLVIGPLSAMWAWWAKLDMDPNLGLGLIIAKTRQQGPELYKSDKGVSDAAHPPEGGPVEAGGFWPQVCHWTLIVRHGCRTVRWKASARNSGWLVFFKVVIFICFIWTAPDKSYHIIVLTNTIFSIHH